MLVTGQVEFFNDLLEQERIVLVLDGEMKRDDIMSILELKHRDNFMNNYLNPAISKGWVERAIPDKPTSSEQKYRLSKAGLKHKETLKNDRK